MKFPFIPRLLLTLLTFVFGGSPDLAAQASGADEFAQLNQRRELRKSLVDYLKAEGLVEETTGGLLASKPAISERAQGAVDAENAERQRQFAIVAVAENRPAREIARDFARRLGVNVDAPVVALRIHGSNTVGASLAPALMEKFLQSTGASIVHREKNGVETRIHFREDGADAKSPVKVVEIGAYGSETAFAGTPQHPEVGLMDGHCDIGMSSRPIRDEEAEALKARGLGDLRTISSSFPVALDGVAIMVNPANTQVAQLTVEQVARIFAGEIKGWKELGGEDKPITLYARDDQSGTYDTFKSKVLKPHKRSIAKSANRFEDSYELVRKLAADPLGIGFVGLPYADSTISLIAVQAGSDTRPLSATRLTVKSLDYPLSRLLYFYAPASRNKLAADFLTFCLGNEAQAVADLVGFVGQGAATEADIREADALTARLQADPGIPQQYKQWINGYHRHETAANIRFESGLLEPDVNSMINIRRLAGRIGAMPTPPSSVLLIGFADNVGNDAGNLKLSRSRAEAVAKSLERLGLSNIQVEAMGEEMPVADNSGEDGRSSNRRVEIWLKP